MIGRCHLVTDTRFGRHPLASVAAALEAGFDVVQVRLKEEGDRAALSIVEDAVAMCRRSGAQCIVDDRLDVALAAEADGVHLGETDLPVRRARALGGPRLLIGATVRDPDSAAQAERDGASYLGAGPAWATSTKAGLPAPIGVEGVSAVCSAAGVPVVAIGGIDAERIPALVRAGAHGVAVVSAVSDADDPGSAAAVVVAALRAATTGSRP